MTDTQQHEPWAQLLTLGDARFGILAGGPFDGRCYPLSEGPVPRELDVPGLPRPEQPASFGTCCETGSIATPASRAKLRPRLRRTSRTLWTALILLLPLAGGRPAQRR
jgi:hypothetical protein